MVSTQQLLGFAAMALAIIVIPGPTVLFVVGRALAHGRATALTSVVGNELGVVVLTAAVAFGVGSIVERSVVVFTALKLAGAAYIVYLGAQAFRHRHALHEAMGRPAEADPGRARELWQGFVVGVTNPKTTVFFAAVLPQFVDRDLGHVPLQMMVFGLVFAVIALLCDSVWGLAAGTARAWFARSPRRLAAVGGTGGLMMIGLGFAIATTGRKD
ncbi:MULTISPECIES: LysE family translocator [Actinomadura]|uniref:LysE family translocator n=1 Tax=Actinomadura litoris TaxID=2678616 RepID=A0A7K1L2S6_9ACTN|nr:MULTISPECIES: LysE family translocator [Actinomadura]MBT2208681.1 LysE family translocator [Actinomadura sp. NEAU-AAG7]MUN38748.1 LysE family translocator [Actinomadura litoris]